MGSDFKNFFRTVEMKQRTEHAAFSLAVTQSEASLRQDLRPAHSGSQAVPQRVKFEITEQIVILFCISPTYKTAILPFPSFKRKEIDYCPSVIKLFVSVLRSSVH